MDGLAIWQDGVCGYGQTQMEGNFSWHSFSVISEVWLGEREDIIRGKVYLQSIFHIFISFILKKGCWDLGQSVKSVVLLRLLLKKAGDYFP